MSINLLPWRTMETQRNRQYALIRLICTLIFTILIFCAYRYSLNKSILDLKLHIPTVQSQKSLNSQYMKNKLVILKLDRLINTKIALIKSNNQLGKLIDFLNAIATLLPDSMRLTEINFDNKSIFIKGVSNKLLLVHHYVDAINKLPNTYSLSLSDINIRSSNINFTLKGNITT